MSGHGPSQRSGWAYLKVVFPPNYNISLAESIIPAADLSEQISMAGKEASGTGNMKLALNGAVTIGTLDGANVEIRDRVGADNFFLFGLDADRAAQVCSGDYRPRDYYERDEELRRALDAIAPGAFGGAGGDVAASLLGRDEYSRWPTSGRTSSARTAWSRRGATRTGGPGCRC